MKKQIITLVAVAFTANCLLPIFSFGQGIGINTTGATPDPSAMFDISATNKGLLIPRMTTAQRNAIGSPALGLMIFNTTTNCFDAYVGGAWNTVSCPVPCTPTTAAAGPDQTICATTATLAGNTPTVGTGLWTLISGAGTITSPASPTSGLTALGVGANTFRWTISNAPCTPSTDDVIITRSDVPTTAAAGPDQTLPCGNTTTTLAGNTPIVGTGLWSVISGIASITTPGSPTSGVTGLAASGTATLRWTISNSPCTPSTDDVIITTTSCAPCPSPVPWSTGTANWDPAGCGGSITDFDQWTGAFKALAQQGDFWFRV